ncbi:DNA polymerase III subunit psi [Shewanella sp. GXUN23E]|uniref:DNA polymerase III subunit psi n=1 Tax=Shewanella sp. GXUN23E TaxID=3422498 RepID=UPI003D7EFE43
MKQQDYLDAMGISRWRVRSGEPRCLLLCDDPRLVTGHPLVAAVLRVMGLDIDKCHVADQLQAGDRVIWDMRLMNRPHKPGILYSSPLPKLLVGSEGKRALWQQICKLKSQLAAEGAESQ